jgi:hypothetical protein
MAYAAAHGFVVLAHDLVLGAILLRYAEKS